MINTTLVIKEGKCNIAWVALSTFVGWATFAYIIISFSGNKYNYSGMAVVIVVIVITLMIALLCSNKLGNDIQKEMILSFNNTSSGDGGDDGRLGGNNGVMIRNGLFIPTLTFTWDEIGPIILEKTYKGHSSPISWGIHVKDSPHNPKLNFSCRIDRLMADKLETLFQRYQPGKLRVKTRGKSGGDTDRVLNVYPNMNEYPQELR